MTRKILGLLVTLAVLISTFSAAIPVRAAAPPVINNMTYDLANLAKGAPVTTTSGTFQGSPALVTDNNWQTTWYATTGSPNQVVLNIDLLALKLLGYAAVTAVNVTGVRLLVSQDGSTWNAVGEKTWPIPVDGPVAFPMNGQYVDKQFLRVELWTTSASPIGVSEVEAYGWTGYIEPYGQFGAVNIALNKPVTSYDGTPLTGYEAAKMVDGNLSSEFRLTATDANGTLWGNVMVDLGAKYPIGKVTLDPRNAHWYRISLKGTLTDTFERRVFSAFPDLYGTTGVTSAHDEFPVYGTKTTQYVYVWTQLDRPPQAMDSAVQELQVYTWDPPTAAEISVNRPIFSFEALQGSSPPVQELVIFNSGGSTLNYTAVSTQSWLTLSKGSGGPLARGQADVVLMTVDSSTLASGSYTANIVISDPNSSNKSVAVAVNLKVGVPTVSVAPVNLVFTADPGVNPATQTIAVGNSGVGALSFTITSNQPWLTAAPAAGSNIAAGSSVNVVVTAATAALAPGTYNAALSITNQFNNSVTTVPVAVSVSQPPAITLSTAATLSLGAQVGGAASGSIRFRNSGGGILNWSASSNATWLQVSPASGSLRSTDPDATLAVTANAASLAAGTYTGVVTIGATGVTPQTVTVTLIVSSLPAISVSSSTLSFSATTDQGAQTLPLAITNSGGGILAFSIAASPADTWLTLSVSSGTAAAGQAVPLTVTCNPTGLAAGVYNTTLTVTASGASNSPVVIPVRLTLTVKPAIALSATSVTLRTTPVSNPPNAYLTISNSGGGTLTWSASTNTSWLTVSPSAGSTASGPSTVTLTASTANMAPGTYTSRVAVESAGASNSPQYFNLTVIISETPSVSVLPGSLNLTAQAGATAPATQKVTLTASGPVTDNWSAVTDAAWLTVSPATGNLLAQTMDVTVSASVTGLAAGDYAANVTFNFPGTANTQVIVPVAFTVTAAPPPPPGGARTFKQDAVATLQAVSSRDRCVGKEINDAVLDIQKSLKASYWLDNRHLNPAQGDQVFKYEAKAAQELMELNKAPRFSPGVRDAARAALKNLIMADLQLAQTAYDEAVPQVTSRRGKLLLQTADEFIDRADYELHSKKVNYAQVINRYGEAWKYVQLALKAHDPPPPPPPAGDTARALKTNTMNALAALQVADRGVSNNLKAAVKYIGESLDPKLWIDADFLNPKYGNKVFDRERQAAHELMQVMDDRDAPAAIKTVAKLSAENLVAADKDLAGDAFNQAKRYAGDKKVDKELAQAAGYIVKARMEMGKRSPDYRDAIQYYNKAWESAQQAIKYGTGHDNDDRDCDWDRDWLKGHGWDRDRNGDRNGDRYWNRPNNNRGQGNDNNRGQGNNDNRDRR